MTKKYFKIDLTHFDLILYIYLKLWNIPHDDRVSLCHCSPAKCCGFIGENWEDSFKTLFVCRPALLSQLDYLISQHTSLQLISLPPSSKCSIESVGCLFPRWRSGTPKAHTVSIGRQNNIIGIKHLITF